MNIRSVWTEVGTALRESVCSRNRRGQEGQKPCKEDRPEPSSSHLPSKDTVAPARVLYEGVEMDGYRVHT